MTEKTISTKSTGYNGHCQLGTGKCVEPTLGDGKGGQGPLSTLHPQEHLDIYFHNDGGEQCCWDSALMAGDSISELEQSRSQEDAAATALSWCVPDSCQGPGGLRNTVMLHYCLQGETTASWKGCQPHLEQCFSSEN